MGKHEGTEQVTLFPDSEDRDVERENRAYARAMRSVRWTILFDPGFTKGTFRSREEAYIFASENYSHVTWKVISL